MQFHKDAVPRIDDEFLVQSTPKITFLMMGVAPVTGSSGGRGHRTVSQTDREEPEAPGSLLYLSDREFAVKAAMFVFL